MTLTKEQWFYFLESRQTELIQVKPEDFKSNWNRELEQFLLALTLNRQEISDLSKNSILPVDDFSIN